MKYPNLDLSKMAFFLGRVMARNLALAVCITLAGAGCAKKQIRAGMPFDLDKVFTGLPSLVRESWKEKGIRLAKEKQFDQAIQAFMEHVAEEPEDFFGFNGIAVCYKNTGDHSNAMKNYERALEFAESPEDKAKVLANIGNLYFTTGKPQAALGYYKEAAAEFDKNPLYLVFIARTFVVLNDYDRARKVLTSAEEMHKDLEKYERDEDKGLGSYLMAYCYLALDQEEKVFQHLENALRASPEKYKSRIQSDISDEKSLLYTLKDDPQLKKVLKKYSAFSAASRSNKN
ncbi:MAG: tetratricopeptide repeat protein [Desulfomonile tiedjei]|uniref:RING-type E3 ubiquitin transferase n=1 Tax=Desulfomonile tiedjei TaxID=2358 RepID=A0A9D6V5R8_9BACT|nr:tetratricopeptide repeat protein [Desulfomonile tiedjei]